MQKPEEIAPSAVADLSDAAAPKGPSWLRRHIIAPIRRSHWIFSLPEFIRLRLEMQDHDHKRFANLEGVVRQYAQAQNTAAKLLRDVNQRLAHYEKGVLKASKAELDRRRGDGMARPIEAKRNGGKRSAPAKSIDATGKLKELPPEPTDEGGKPA